MKAKKPKLTKVEVKLYCDCLGHCRICVAEGGCKLEEKLIKLGLKR